MTANNEIRYSYTEYNTEGTTGFRYYDVQIAQDELGVADFSEEKSDNDSDAVVFEI